MKRVLVIGGDFTEDVLSKYRPADVELEVLPLQSLICGWDGNKLLLRHATGKSLHHYDAVYLSGWGKAASIARFIAFYFAQHGIPAFNVQLFDTWPVTKVAELCRLPAAGVNHPRTVCTQETRNFPLLVQWANRELKFQLPLVVKAIGGARGESNFWVRSHEDTVTLNPELVYLVQEFIPNNGDYRILIIDGQPAVAIFRQRQSPDTHLNNTSQGSKATIVPLHEVDPRILDISVRAAHAMNRTELAGVDVVVHAETNVPYVLEVNLCPDITAGLPEETNVKAKVTAVFDALKQRMTRKREYPRAEPSL